MVHSDDQSLRLLTLPIHRRVEVLRLSLTLMEASNAVSHTAPDGR
jgi:hypothetical protein